MERTGQSCEGQSSPVCSSPVTVVLKETGKQPKYNQASKNLRKIHTSETKKRKAKTSEEFKRHEPKKLNTGLHGALDEYNSGKA